jgi:hypothetical protein
VPGSLVGLSGVAVVGTFVGSAAGLLFVSCGFEEVVGGADVWAGNPESTVDLGVAVGDVVAECNVGTAMASAGCNALGANAVDQQCHIEDSSDMHVLTIEKSSIPSTARFPRRIQTPSLWRHPNYRRVRRSSGT